VAEGIDLAVRMGTLDDSELVARKLTSVCRHLVASPVYLAKHGTPLHPSELAGQCAIVTTRSLARWRFADGWESEPRWSIAAGNMLVAHQLALAGNGIAMLPDFLMQDDLEAGRLTRILAAYLHDEADAWLVSSRQRYRSPAVRAVLDEMTTNILLDKETK
jgi:DNA-binding transcriptional LysR family regulator